MAKYDHGGGCPCGLYRECIPQCKHMPIVIAKKVKNKMNDDFGFSMVSNDELVANIPVDTRAEELCAMIMPLLNNLKLNPEKDYIQWKGAERIKQIDAFIKKMNNLIDS